MAYVYLLTGKPGDLELARAEAEGLTDGDGVSDRLVQTDRLADRRRAAYLGEGIELLASGRDVAAAARALAEREITAEGFAVEIRRIPHRLKVNRHKAASALGWVIGGRPNLDRPSVRFLAFVTADGVWVGRKLPPFEPDWTRFVRKPCDFSSALPAQAARALCNLRVRGGESVVDPCCGSGTLLLHAAALGAQVTGYDISKKMVGSTNKNLEHFGFAPAASLGDAARVEGEFDVLLANLPYGNMSELAGTGVSELLGNLVGLAPRGVLVAGTNVAPELAAAGAEVERTLRLAKFSLPRFILAYRRT
jgi:tRNA G10  N-methylase Trm11